MPIYHDPNYSPGDLTNSPPALELCRSWIENCIKNHDKCKGLKIDTWWPTRLLYVGHLSSGDISEKDPSSLTIQLHSTRDKQPQGSYITLSHCWGDSKEILKLTADEYDDRIKNGFSYAELPKTFQDVCNIAATASRGPAEGCFYPRNPVTVFQKFMLKGEVTKDPPVERYFLLNHSCWDETVEDAPLNKRAWVMQERALAPRQIHCGRDQLLWECPQMTGCEPFPLAVQFRPLGSGPAMHMTECMPELIFKLSEISQTLEQPQSATRDMSIKHMRYDIYQYWARIVDHYSTCALTYRTDKLVAISGIASRIQHALKYMDDYVAGLWRSQLPQQLLWQIQGIKEDSTPSYTIGPSWSWACLDTNVYFPIAFAGRFTLIDILDVHDGHTITGKGESPLKLRCILRKIYYAAGKSPYILTCVHNHGDEEPSPRECKRVGVNKDNVHMDSVESRNCWKDWKEVYMMPVLWNMVGDSSAGLMVSSVGQERPGFYRRIVYHLCYLRRFYCNSDKRGEADHGICV
ncbi:hypothetical protein F5B20DRAFT_150338 [Whalleya microplaca]|nr:hypothetical protein F5B20DRAFT_150338 [Whalleya microplaca]